MIKASIRIALFLAFAMGSSLAANAQESLTNEKIWYSRTFSTDYVSGFNSMNDGSHYTRLEFDRGGPVVSKYSFETNSKVGTIVSTTELSDLAGHALSIDAYSFSADESKMLIASNTEPIYRHSTRGEYYIYDIAAKKVKPLATATLGKQRLAEFSPKGDKVAFVRNNNLFVTDVATGEEKQVTQDGKINEVINGGTDWVYEEEFGFDKGFYWSPNGRYIAFYRFDETHVKEFQMAMYGELYPDQYKFKYPKAGEDNAHVSIHVYNVMDNNTRQVDIGPELDQYIPRIKWTSNEDHLMVLRMNRLQNNLDFIKVDLGVAPQVGLTSKVVYNEKADTYVEISDNMYFLQDGKSFLWTSEMSGYNHIWRIYFDGKKQQITTGDYDVTSLYGVNEKTGLIYYQSAEESAMERDIYTIKLNGKSKKKLSTRKGQNDGTFSTGMKYFVNYHSSANTPYYITLHDGKGKELHTLVDNASMVKRMKEYGLTEKEFFTLKTSEDVELNAWMIKPANFDASKKYPVFMTVYNGPGINTVNDSWGGATMLWHHMLAQNGYLVVSVDGRGTGYRGAEFKKVTYKQLGKYETMDQIEAAKWLAKQPYVDGNRIGIQGWSYGGYMTSLCMTKGADVFKMGIAVAPVTNWRYYDSIYTERYMQRPQENADGYDDNSPINHVNKLKGKFLIVHGSADDNVHYQNTMEMISALVKANKPFEQAIYPNKNHGIYGGTTRLHLFTKMTDFVLQNL